MSAEAPSVLIVEDDPGIRTLLSRLVARLGLTCRVAQDGEEALLAVAEGTPDLIILDLMMPGMNGFQFLRAYREGGALETPVIVVTAKDDAFDQFWAHKLGVRHFLVKPFAPQAILGAIEEALSSTPHDANSPPSSPP
jgi:two-component system response regulator AdeR